MELRTQRTADTDAGRVLQPLTGDGNADRNRSRRGVILRAGDSNVVHGGSEIDGNGSLRRGGFQFDNGRQCRCRTAASLEVVRCGYFGHLARFTFNLPEEEKGKNYERSGQYGKIIPKLCTKRVRKGYCLCDHF